MGNRKDASKRIRLKLRYLIFVICLGSLWLLLYAKTRFHPQRNDPSLARTPAKLTQTTGRENPGRGALDMSPSRKSSLIKLDLIENPASPRIEDSGTTARNIFQPWTPPEAVLPKVEEPQQKAEVEAKKEESAKSESNIKLLGIIEKQANAPKKELIRYAIVSIGGEIMVVKKGDVVIDQYEVLQIEEETAEVLNKATGAVEKLSIEKES